MKTKVIKLHFKKGKPIYHKFYIKKKKTKNGKNIFCKKIKKLFFKWVDWDNVSSPGLRHANFNKQFQCSWNWS